MLDGLFAMVCHQVRERCFSVGGAALPFCERCTGVYLGAVAAALLLASFGRRQRRALPAGPAVFNVLCILAMGLFGFHVIDTSADGRYVTGALFGAAVVMLAWPLLLEQAGVQRLEPWRLRDLWHYGVTLAAVLIVPLVFFHQTIDAPGWVPARYALIVLGASGLLLVTALPVALAALLIVQAFRRRPGACHRDET